MYKFIHSTLDIWSKSEREKKTHRQNHQHKCLDVYYITYFAISSAIKTTSADVMMQTASLISCSRKKN